MTFSLEALGALSGTVRAPGGWGEAGVPGGGILYLALYPLVECLGPLLGQDAILGAWRPQRHSSEGFLMGHQPAGPLVTKGSPFYMCTTVLICGSYNKFIITELVNSSRYGPAKSPHPVRGSVSWAGSLTLEMAVGTWT